MTVPRMLEKTFDKIIAVGKDCRAKETDFLLGS